MPNYRIWSAEGAVTGAQRNGTQARELLCQATALPTLHLYPRADGPGSSQDLPQFAAMGNRIPQSPPDWNDPCWRWSRGCLRTLGACIDGEPIVFRVQPAENPQATEYYSPDFHSQPISLTGVVPGRPEYFVNNILQQFDLQGVRIEAEPMPSVYRGTGLGGSNLAHTAALLFASALSGMNLSPGQIYVAGAQLENLFGVRCDEQGNINYGVSMTGGQESLAALQGGFYDNVHIPLTHGPFAVVSRELVNASDYPLLAEHMVLVNVGVKRGQGVTSSQINNSWMRQWQSGTGAMLHHGKADLAYRSAEALRTGNWPEYLETVSAYRQIRELLCPAYVTGQEELANFCKETRAEYFPLGAGTGTSLVVAADSGVTTALMARVLGSADAATGRTALPFNVRHRGVEFFNFVENGLRTCSCP
jgi:hypothetical protein